MLYWYEVESRMTKLSSTQPSTSEMFDNFVKREVAATQKELVIDWDKEREEWLQRLRDLHNQIESYINDYITSGAISVSKTNVELNEEGVGTYLAPKLTIKIGRQEISFTPAGTMLIGSKGRVDVYGTGAKGRIVLVRGKDSKTSKAPEWVWKIGGAPPYNTLIPLDRESFLKLLIEVSAPWSHFQTRT
jgi:hypothetical protein